MYYKSVIVLTEEIKGIKKEELIKKAKAAAGKVEELGAFSIFPYLLDEESLYVAYYSTKSCLFCFYDFLIDIGLEESEYSREKISNSIYQELKKEARNKGYIYYPPRLSKKLSPSQLDEMVEVLDVPTGKLHMPMSVEYPISLRSEMERIENAKSHYSPVIYYIISEERDRREAMREALISSLRENGMISSSSYFNLSLEKDYSGYDSNWSLVDELYKRATDSPVVFSLYLSHPIISFDPEAKTLAQSMATNQGKITILEGYRYSEGLVRAIKEECRDFHFVLIEDPGYTKEDLRIIARKSYDEDLFIDYNYIYKQIDNSDQKYFDEDFVSDFQGNIYGYKDEKLEEDKKRFRASLLNSFYRNENHSPITTLKEEPLPKEAKALIFNILYRHESLEERKLRGMDMKPLYRESYNDWRENPYDITTEIPSLNMVFYGDRGRGKKRTAELYCGILHQFGLTVKDSFKIITKGEIISKDTNDTMKRIMKVFDDNKGGVIYIDWGERGISEEENKEEYSILSSIIRLIDENKRKLVVILSISERNMKEYSSNEGDMLSSFPYSLHFPSLTLDDLWTYFSFLVSKEGYKRGKGLKEKVTAVLEDMSKKDNFAGRISIQKLLEKGKMNMSLRLSTSDFSTLPESAFTTLKPRDFDNLVGLE